MQAEERKLLLNTVRAFVNREVKPVASKLERKDEYPTAIVDRLKELGLFGAIIPEAYGGLGLDCTTYAMIVEELAKGWMSVTGFVNTHLIMAHAVIQFGTEAQKKRLLPRMATGELRGGLCLTESHAGSDLQAIHTVATRDGDHYVLRGSKMWITNGEHGNAFAILAKTDPNAEPRHRGMSLFVAEKGPGLRVGRHLEKLGYRGIDTVELYFEDFRIPANNLVGEKEGGGFTQVMSGLEVGRINIAARAVGVAQSALEEAIRYSKDRKTFGKPISEHQAIQLRLAEMATKIEAARLLTYSAAEKKDRGERCDLEAGMAKLFASETCQEVSLDAMRVLGANGYASDYPVERYYRDAPLMIIGEGTNDIQKLVIARGLLRKYES